jgi:hypothetical protein
VGKGGIGADGGNAAKTKHSSLPYTAILRYPTVRRLARDAESLTVVKAPWHHQCFTEGILETACLTYLSTIYL